MGFIYRLITNLKARIPGAVIILVVIIISRARINGALIFNIGIRIRNLPIIIFCHSRSAQDKGKHANYLDDEKPKIIAPAHDAPHTKIIS
ncbi:hypothetical protein AO963_33540 [Pseudomonas aeruginosa]|nr:hypothetical protein AO963_33540 [Pseudomonas aeruginosa]